MALGRDNEVGTIQPGMVADLVLLGDNPLQDIGMTRKVEAVMLRGRLLAGEMLVAARASDAR